MVCENRSDEEEGSMCRAVTCDATELQWHVKIWDPFFIIIFIFIFFLMNSNSI